VVQLDAQGRLSRSQRLDASIGLHSLRASSNSTTFRFQYGYEGDRFFIRPGFKRELRYDSFLSLIGQTIAGTFFGAARSNLFFTELGWQPGSWKAVLTPYAGWVSAQNVSRNAQVGVDLWLESPPFVQQDHWSIKSLQRRLLLSSVYRQSSAARPDAQAIDPTNRLLWAFPRQRLDAEEIRDSLLLASGLLEDKLGGPAVFPPVPVNFGVNAANPNAWPV